MANGDTISEYNTAVNNLTELNNQFFPGYFYTYYYDYKKDTVKFFNVPKNIRDFYDGRPLVFMYERYIDKSGKHMARGINLHYMPVRARQFWISQFHLDLKHLRLR